MVMCARVEVEEGTDLEQDGYPGSSPKMNLQQNLRMIPEEAICSEKKADEMDQE